MCLLLCECITSVRHMRACVKPDVALLVRLLRSVACILDFWVSILFGARGPQRQSQATKPIETDGLVFPYKKNQTLSTSITGHNSCIYLAPLAARRLVKGVHLVSTREKGLSAKRRKQLNRQSAKLNPKGGWGCNDE